MSQKKELARGMFEKGLRPEVIAELLLVDREWVANTLLEAGYSPGPISEDAGPRNRYAQMLAGILRFRHLEAAKASVEQMGKVAAGFRAMGDSRGVFHAQQLALTGYHRARAIGKTAEAEVFRVWLTQDLEQGERAVKPAERKADAPFDFASEARLWGEAEARVMEAEYNLSRAVAALTHAARAAGREQVREAEERAQQTQAVAALLGD